MVDRQALETYLAQVVSAPVAAPIAAISEAARARHGSAVQGVLFYGSCLREEGDSDKIVDLYLLVDDYRWAHDPVLDRLGNALLPPNVYFLETPYEDRTVRAKYAVISLRDFERGATGAWLHSYIWARFAQPCRLTYSRDAESYRRVVGALAGAAGTAVAEASILLPGSFSAKALWERCFLETYGSELRAERPERIPQVYAEGRSHYEKLANLLLPVAPGQDETGALLYSPPPQPARPATAARWRRRRLAGKLLSVLRLVKAAFTFRDGATYILWKIERHSGVHHSLSPWQKRHPILASTVIFWQLYRKGAFR